ncbi:16S rRNA (cytidine(1402)-2'-O)-methyltransferase [Mesobaculum littorinae]|uniref:Ribosomal RNA small subunit methyltransferase I n=1 Tax=Mesobaculum littorinae TaxID=2486419 RepID=A0A438AFF6_9RHOB|nr:16S rRNA (cytidine(1402)-2'-O)-methyltransferase [Mesobaculum littorinae]RVV97418.1 16S rRNA (cytidine(1402)-2'-O)-methyltransferase [Mesobaculum littorinae]
MTERAEIRPLKAGLYLLATPIGTARDITLRALDILASADVIAAEDTRTARKLMEIHGIAVGGRPVISYHDHNGRTVRPRLLAMIAEGRSVAYASEAGTPLVADPGYALAREAAIAGHHVTGAPGPSAALAALTLSGLPSDRFLFAGFLPTGGAARRKALAELAPVPATLIIFESPKRCLETVKEMETTLGDREAALCRELTKKFEQVMRGPLSALRQRLEEGPALKGEVVLVVDRDRGTASDEDMRAALASALPGQSVKDAAREVAERLGLKRRDVYQAALEMGGAQGRDET